MTMPVFSRAALLQQDGDIDMAASARRSLPASWSIIPSAKASAAPMRLPPAISSTALAAPPDGAVSACPRRRAGYPIASRETIGGLGRGDTGVTPQGELVAAAQRRTADRRDKGLWRTLNGADHLRQLRRSERQVEFLDIGPDHEGLPGADQNRSLDRRVGIHLLDQRQERGPDAARPGIDRRIVDDQERHIAVNLKICGSRQLQVLQPVISIAWCFLVSCLHPRATQTLDCFGWTDHCLWRHPVRPSVSCLAHLTLSAGNAHASWTTKVTAAHVWRRVADRLIKHGHRVFTPTLTGLGERSHLMSADRPTSMMW